MRQVQHVLQTVAVRLGHDRKVAEVAHDVKQGLGPQPLPPDLLRLAGKRLGVLGQLQHMRPQPGLGSLHGEEPDGDLGAHHIEIRNADIVLQLIEGLAELLA